MKTRPSTDPDFTAKMRRILDLYDHPPTEGRVICVDEFGPLNLQPRPGHAWRSQGQPVRLSATYTRDQGVRHMIAGLKSAHVVDPPVRSAPLRDPRLASGGGSAT